MTEERMSEEQQTGQGEIERTDAHGADAAPDAGAAAAASAAAHGGAEAAVEGVKAGDDPPQALATPHGHEGDYDPLAEAEKLPPPPEPEGGEGDDGADGPLDLS